MDAMYQLAGQYAAAGFRALAPRLVNLRTAERRALEDEILDAALLDAEAAGISGPFRDAWEWDERLQTWLQPA